MMTVHPRPILKPQKSEKLMSEYRPESNAFDQNSRIEILKSLVDGSRTVAGRVYGRVNVKNRSVLPRCGRVDG
jgi:hypothetical protein